MAETNQSSRLRSIRNWLFWINSRRNKIQFQIFFSFYLEEDVIEIKMNIFQGIDCPDCISWWRRAEASSRLTSLNRRSSSFSTFAVVAIDPFLCHSILGFVAAEEKKKTQWNQEDEKKMKRKREKKNTKVFVAWHVEENPSKDRSLKC